MKLLAALIATAFALVLGLGAGDSRAQAFPTSPIKIVVGYTAGGGTDVNARTIAGKMAENMGHPVIVENRPGAGGMLAAEHVAKAPPDGHTLMLAGLTVYAVNPSLYTKISYDPLKDYAPVALTGTFGMVLVVNPQTSIHTLQDFLREARAANGKMTFGSAGAGSSNQLAMELLMQRENLKMTHVPYKGSANAMIDVISGVIPTMFIDLATASSQLKTGKLRIIAAANKTRAPSLPDVPTVAESGVPGYEMVVWQGIVAPSGTPKHVIQTLNAEINKAMADPAIKARLAGQGIEPLSGTVEEFDAYLKNEYKKWTEVITKGNIKAN